MGFVLSFPFSYIVSPLFICKWGLKQLYAYLVEFIHFINPQVLISILAAFVHYSQVIKFIEFVNSLMHAYNNDAMYTWHESC